MLLVNKPAGLLAQSDRTGDMDVAALAREYVRVAANKTGEAFVALVHRLDRPGGERLLVSCGFICSCSVDIFVYDVVDCQFMLNPGLIYLCSRQIRLVLYLTTLCAILYAICPKN